MRVTVDNVCCRVAGFTSDEYMFISELLTVTGKYDYVTGNRRQEQFYTFDKSANVFIFGSGLLEYFIAACTSRGYKVEIIDNRRRPLFENNYSNAVQRFTPYPDQEQVVDVMIGRVRGVLNLATNYGKTYLYMRFWNKLNCPNMLIVVPTQALLTQTVELFRSCMGVDIGWVGIGKYDWRPVTVAIINSVNNWLDEHSKLPYIYDILIIDEGHLGVGREYQRLAWVCDAPFRFWCSGTAYKDGDKIHEFLITSLAGPCIANVRNDFLVKQGRSAFPLIRFINNRFTGDLASFVTWRQQYSLLKSDVVRNKWIVDIANRANEMGLTTMIFCEHVDEHAYRLAGQIKDSEVAVGGRAVVNEGIKRRLLDGSLKVVICTSTWRVGVSIPGVDVLIQASGGRAVHNRLQEFGRVLRKGALGHCYYIDFNDFGLSYLRRQSLLRYRAMLSEGFPVKHVSCLDDVFSLGFLNAQGTNVA